MIARKNQLILILCLLLITGFLLTSLMSYVVSRDSLRAQIAENELPLTSDNIYSEIQRDLLRPVFISSLMATDTFLRDWVIHGEQDQDRIIRYLKEIQTRYNTFTSFFVSEQTRIYYHADGVLKKVKSDEKRDQWYFRVRKMQADYEINVDPDMANKDAMTVFINHRVYDYRGNYIGAAGVGLTVHAVKNLIEKYQQDYGRNIYFADQQGAITLHAASFRATAQHIHDLDGVSTIADTILATHENALKYDSKQGRFYLNSRYIPELKWYLIVEQADEKATENIRKALMGNLAICAVIVVVVLFLTHLTLSTYQCRLEKMATTDKLTNIYNRQAFDIIVRQTLKDVLRHDIPVSIILFDIDFFKNINDTFGHLAGDAVLRNVAEVTRAILRESDVLCRWGGEEFVILLKECELKDACGIAEKVRSAVKSSPVLYQGEEIPLTISLGVAQYRLPEDEVGMLRRADQALYEAKQKGRDRTERWGGMTS